MNAVEFFLIRHDNLHENVANQLVHGLTETQIRQRPREDVNSIAWLIWHMARCEDVGVNRLVMDRPQVLDREGWLPRLRVPLRQYGTGMTDDEVAEFSACVDINALRAYWAAVGQSTRDALTSLHPDKLDEVVDATYLHHVLFDEGVLGPNAGWVEEFYTGKTRGSFLGHLGLTHNYSHAGEAFLVRGLLGLRRR